MVGIVIVSHSKQLALGIQELAMQMVQGRISLAVAAGIDDPENPLGTDPIQVHQAIANVYSDDGVLVLMDLGSAVMSAEMAVEFLDPEQREKVHLLEAPLVEGAIAAVVAAACGSNIEQVIAEARGALAAKASQLGIVSSQWLVVSNEESRTNSGENIQEIRLNIRNHLGLHARPAAQFVACAARFQSQIKVRNLTRNTEAVRADSINKVLTLGVSQGHELMITATGTDASQAIAAFQALVENNFGEHTSGSISHSSLQGIPASGGVAIAPVFLYRPAPHEVLRSDVNDVDTELQLLENAIQAARQEIQLLLSQASTQIGDSEAAIFDAHLLFLEDPTLLEAVHQRILQQHLNVEVAWSSVVEELANQYRTLDDSYLQARAADVVDVGQRVLRLLLGHETNKLNFSRPGILVTTDLSPSDTVQLDRSKVLGICTTYGSATSHSAIIARSLGIPAVLGVSEEVLHLADGTLMALDGESGEVWLEPETDILAALEVKRDARQTMQQQALFTANQPAITRDSQQITVVANIGGIADAQVAVNLGAEGVGLLRTEFLYLQKTTAPSEEEQYQVYQAIAQILDKRPLIIRTLDIGGDKSLPYLNLPSETNPFLGLRGIRFCLDRQDIFKTQLRAILRASVQRNIKVMFPMIATVEEIQAAKAILAQVQAELQNTGIPFDEEMEVGMMIEVPSAVVLADKLAAEVDFFSIGTNDLSQYVMACDRTNPRVANLADALHPAVLRMIQTTVQAAHTAGIWVSLCGEVASDPLAAPILLGLGLDEVSLNPQAILAFKQAIARFTLAQAQAIATTALQQDSVVKVRELLL
ncbi:MAG: phosphoenolpyruvate--protein phosphotransferase [Cyanomargarita calcarea GSE-NOS-MK-12-04C]|uniref:Phosphocarrier protein HPr n=1 Tax=Cyanomargarita calcarea GSE-NOS-MK-12-04C TaxID=2839659 RepID=A0A951UVS0_9CYAN|nr:phosphoenolpyruvate--protein phosphotransferase [Cyanomargarita calcarea GSE-NOS-MK-12-04C]